jgi:hypothetical protein
VTHSAVCHEGVRTSRGARQAAATSEPTVARSAPAVAPGLAAAGSAPSRIPAGRSRPGSAPAAHRPLRRPSQVPVGTSPVLQVVGRGGGRPLDPKVRADMEARLGGDFSDVRVHTGDQAAESAAAISATAYTVGHEVVFGPGSFDPASHQGRQRLAHELVHVRQQRHGPVSGTDSGDGVAISDPADSFEREAEATAAAVASAPAPGAPGDAPGASGGALGAPGDLRGGPSVQLTGGRSVQRCGGIPCDCTADERDRVERGGADALALQPVQRAAGAGGPAPGGGSPAPGGGGPPVPTFQQIPNVGRGGGRWDTGIDRSTCVMHNEMRVNFVMSDSVLPWPGGDAKNRWKARYLELVQQRWSQTYDLEPSAPCPAEPCKKVGALMHVVESASNPHFNVTVVYTRSFRQSSASPGSASLDSLDIDERGDIPQTPAEHEFGHMLGLPHIHCNSNAPVCYGVTDEEKADIMGLGSRVSTLDYQVFAEVMSQLDGCQWRAVPRPGHAGLGALIGLGAGALTGSLIGLLFGPLGALIGGLIGAAVGAGVGAGIGSAVQ